MHSDGGHLRLDMSLLTGVSGGCGLLYTHFELFSFVLSESFVKFFN